VGALVAELRAGGRLRNTLLIFSSDNGINAGAHRRGGKATPYATQVPFLVSWEARLAPGHPDIGVRIHNIDLAPTLCAIAGCRLGPYPNGQARPDGVSFAAHLGGPGKPVRRAALITDMPTRVKSAPWYAVSTTRWSGLADMGCAAASTHGCRWHYVEYDSGERELYDVSNGPCWAWRRGDPGDPCELRNLAGRWRYRSIQRALHSVLRELRAEGG
jgi:arylsulfatase A-like enzyme